MNKLLLACLLGFAGCVSYTPAQIDWHKEAREIDATQTYTFATFDAVGRAAIIRNRALNMLRLKLANSKRVADVSGLWEDPELDVDALHFTKMSEHPFTRGASLAFTLPLSGVPGCEKRAAEFYSVADAWAVKVAERETAIDAMKAAIELSVCREQGHECDSHELKTLLGLPHGAKIILPTVFVCPSQVKIPDQLKSLDFIRHARVMEVQARLDGSESQLKAEIRRQFPELKLGPAYEREEGIDRLGIVAGVTLPLWNRNRKGIAEATGERDEKSMELIDTWREVVTDYRRAYERLQTAVANASGCKCGNDCKCGDNCRCVPIEVKGELLSAIIEMDRFKLEE